MDSKPLVVFDHKTGMGQTSQLTEGTIVNLLRIVVLQSVVIGTLIVLQAL